MSTLLALPPLVLTAVVFFPLTHNYFFGDDFVHLYEIAQWPLGHFVFTPFAGHVLVVPNLVFWTLAKLVGPHPRPYFWLCLLTHLVNVGLLYRVIRMALGSDLLACFGATLWGACPAHEGTLGWYSVYGQVLATTFVLGALLDGIAPGALSTRRALGWMVLLLLAATSFGTAIGPAVVSPLALWLLRPTAFARRPAAALVTLVPVLVVGCYLGLQAFAAHVEMAQLPGASAAALRATAAQGWQPVVVLLLHLVAAGLAHLCLGFAGPLAPYPSVAAYAVAGVLAAGVVWTCTRRAAPGRRLILAFLLLAFACYGAIAVGRVAFYLQAGVALDRAASATRYHYLASTALTLVVCTVLASLADVVARQRVRDAALGAWLAATVALYATSGLRFDAHAPARQEIVRLLAAVQQRVARAAPGEPITMMNRPLVAVGPWGRKFPGWAAAFMIFSPTNEVDGHTFRFLERDPITIEAVRRTGGRVATLVVAAPAS